MTERFDRPGGMFVDPAQTPTTLMEPSDEAGQSNSRRRILIPESACADARTAITDAYTAAEHALTLVDAACHSGTADEVDGYPDDAQRDLRRALRAIRAAERVFTPKDES